MLGLKLFSGYALVIGGCGLAIFGVSGGARSIFSSELLVPLFIASIGIVSLVSAYREKMKK
jgi:hypothetical protein